MSLELRARGRVTTSAETSWELPAFIGRYLVCQSESSWPLGPSSCILHDQTCKTLTLLVDIPGKSNVWEWIVCPLLETMALINQVLISGVISRVSILESPSLLSQCLCLSVFRDRADLIVSPLTSKLTTTGAPVPTTRWLPNITGVQYICLGAIEG